MTLIEKIDHFREDNSIIADNTSVQNILNQLLDISNNSNTIPKSFELHDLDLLGFEIEDIMENLGYIVQADMLSQNWLKGVSNYKIFVLSER